MSIRRIGVLFGKELTQGSKSYFFIFAILAPLIFTLLVHLVFGTLFSGKPELGIVDYGRSQIVASLKHMQSIDLQQYASVADLKEAVAIGKRDAGMVLLENFDSTIKKGELTKLTVYVWGESLLKNRAMVGSAVLNQIRILSGKSAPVDITPVSLGDENAVSWKDRFLPLIVLMAIFISGFVVPATSLVDEKEKRTIGAILATPATQSDVFVAKGLMGVVASMAMGMVILILNHAFNAQLGLLSLVLFLGTIMAACIGLCVGAFLKDIASSYSAIKGLGIILYGPGIVSLFPQIPAWVGKLFPTYFIIHPIMEISREGGTWSTIKIDVMILIVIIGVFLVITGIIANKTRQQEA